MPESTTPTSSPSSDEELAVLACRGSRSSFEELARRHQVALLHFLWQWTTFEEAEDLTQEAMIRAYENLDRYRPTWKFKTWLFTIARRLCLNLKRRQRPEGRAEALSSLAAASEPAEEVAAAEDRRWLWKLAGDILSERERTVLWLYYAEDMPVKEIARVVGRSPAAIKTMLFRSRRKLAEKMDPVEHGYTVRDKRPR
ncbi:MAG: sigma-70 family RNA polymerase sigma factor [Pirellulaceae bacterium]|nr:sigma-70 family RNA polymerase sigma factor [Pirellulaceae bacterium]